MGKMRSDGGVQLRIPTDTSREIQVHAKTIMEMLNLALDTSLDNRQRRYVESAKSSASLLLALLRELSVGEGNGADAGERLFDADDMAERMEGDREVIVEALDAFLDTCGESVGHVVNAIKGRDQVELRTAAHNLKGKAANVSAKALRAVCTEIEKAAEKGEMPIVDRFPAKLHSLMDRTLAEINNYLNKGVKDQT